MAERCPLSGGGHAAEHLPDFCRIHCEEKWEEALKSQAPDLDGYPDLTRGDCQHPSVVFSHEGLQANDSTPKRHYSIVDACEGCHKELVEESYTFYCDQN